MNGGRNRGQSLTVTARIAIRFSFCSCHFVYLNLFDPRSACRNKLALRVKKTSFKPFFSKIGIGVTKGSSRHACAHGRARHDDHGDGDDHGCGGDRANLAPPRQVLGS